jgi:hypothetical protein
MNYSQVELIAKDLDEMAIIEDDPHIKAKFAQSAAMMRVLLHRYERLVKDKTTFDKRVERMLL